VFLPLNAWSFLFAVALLWAPAAHGVGDPPSAPAVIAVEVVDETGGTVVEIRVEGTLSSFEYFTIDHPPRVVVDLPGVASALASHRFEVASGELRRIRVGRHAEKVRVVLDVEPSVLAAARAVATGRGVAVLLGDVEYAVPIAQPEASPSPQLSAETATKPASAPPPPGPVENSAAPEPHSRPIVYKWIDEHGVVHYTTDRKRVP